MGVISMPNLLLIKTRIPVYASLVFSSCSFGLIAWHLNFGFVLA